MKKFMLYIKYIYLTTDNKFANAIVKCENKTLRLEELPEENENSDE